MASRHVGRGPGFINKRQDDYRIICSYLNWKCSRAPRSLLPATCSSPPQPIEELHQSARSNPSADSMVSTDPGDAAASPFAVCYSLPEELYWERHQSTKSWGAGASPRRLRRPQLCAEVRAHSHNAFPDMYARTDMQFAAFRAGSCGQLDSCMNHSESSRPRVPSSIKSV
jgi:hypothetical protein